MLLGIAQDNMPRTKSVMSNSLKCQGNGETEEAAGGSLENQDRNGHGNKMEMKSADGQLPTGTHIKLRHSIQ